ncbi:MAG: tRNA uridine-5-carboxymethylaminomethyl(34) synthesis GTPase MnmE [Gammaproteobacteria bacterium]|nr:tRNA uridine-5-carboxymethylaminomethyl(34) synthesis GTPase MnmE [Gammaproteobacteria bacterium]
MDTITALATPPGRGGIGVIRISGPLCTEVAKAILGKIPPPRVAEYLPFKDASGETIDIGLALYFSSPHSFTGEDVLELQGHGGPVVMDMLIKRIAGLGVRLARPGEFSERAFLNDKLDLAQAEAIADLIDSASEQAARSALRSLQGEFSRRIHQLVDSLIEIRTYIESAIDFPEEEIDFLQDAQIGEQLNFLVTQLQQTLSEARQGQLLRDGMSVVIAGRPNAGKSTLLNQLTGRESAIVTDIPGTTRDVLREHIQIDGLPLHIIDTAGLRKGSNVVEEEGIRRAWKEISRADRILYLVDATGYDNALSDPLLQELKAAGPGITIVYNKMDLMSERSVKPLEPYPQFLISAKTGAGLAALRNHLKDCAGYQHPGDSGFMARRRHLEALHAALRHVRLSQQQLTINRAGELLAEELRLAQQQLSQITGEFSPDDLLGKIFASFCIGK